MIFILVFKFLDSILQYLLLNSAILRACWLLISTVHGRRHLLFGTHSVIHNKLNANRGGGRCWRSSAGKRSHTLTSTSIVSQFNEIVFRDFNVLNINIIVGRELGICPIFFEGINGPIFNIWVLTARTVEAGVSGPKFPFLYVNMGFQPDGIPFPSSLGSIRPCPMISPSSNTSPNWGLYL